MEKIAFVLSTLGTICICIPPLLKGKNMKLILLLVCLTNVLIGVSYILTGEYNGAASCCVGAIQSTINYFFERKNKAIPSWLIAIYAAAFLVVNLLVFSRITDILALLAALVFILGISQKNGKQYRVWTLANAVLWGTYDMFNRAYGPLTTHAIQTAIILFGMIMHDRNNAKKERI